VELPKFRNKEMKALYFSDFLKILAVFPEIITRGGCERSLLALTERFGMDVIVNKFEPEKSYEGWKKQADKVIEIKAPSKFKFGLNLVGEDLGGYDLYYSHGYFITNMINIRNSPSVWYCHTPKRDLYPPTARFHIKQMSMKKRIPFLMVSPFMRAFDRFLAGRMTRIFSNSENVRGRVKQAYGRDTEVVYSTCIDKVRKTSFGDFYFYPGRLAYSKRIEVAMDAFRQMPDKKLVVAGSAVDKNYLEFLQGIKPKNVELLTNLTEAEYKKLYSGCLATVCIAENEDFGFIPPESMSFGKPCIAADEGGFRESVVSGVNGVLINRDQKSLIEAVKKYEKDFPHMAPSCIKTAMKFTKESYLRGVERVFKGVINESSGK